MNVIYARPQTVIDILNELNPGLLEGLSFIPNILPELDAKVATQNPDRNVLTVALGLFVYVCVVEQNLQLVDQQLFEFPEFDNP